MILELIIDQKFMDEIKNVKEYSLKNIIVVNSQEDAWKVKVAGDNERHTIIHNNIRIVYSIENQKGILYHHISFSSLDSSEIPKPNLCDIIVQLFGMDSILLNREETHIWEEQQAINIVMSYKE